MIFRLILILIILGVLYYLLKTFITPSDYKKCGKCDGMGYWIAARGGRDKCDICRGSGKVLRKS